MKLSVPGLVQRSAEQLGRCNTNLFERGTRLLFSGKEEMVKAFGLNLFLASRMFEGGVVPAVQAFLEVQSDVAESWLDTVSGRKALPDHLLEMSTKTVSGLKYGWLVSHLGGKLFGSANFEGEQRLAENELMTLTYLPPAKGVPLQPPLFHVGGFLPFSDRIFRILPEANLFMHFLARGIPVYAMELRRDVNGLAQVGGTTVERLVEMIDEMSDTAFDHAGRRKMMIEGYCGLALPMLAYLAARPRQADAKFNVAFTMVAPIDGRECKLLHESVETTPRYLLAATFMATELLGGAFPGQTLQAGMDIPLRTLFYKSQLGRFATGWKQQDYAHINRVEQLDFAKRRDLAGAYWISPENCGRHPLPVDIGRMTTRLWLKGLDEALRLRYRYQGQDLTLRTVLDETKIEIAGFYGGKDKVVPESTARILQRELGDRYTQVVHPRAGHISYVLSPEAWNPGHKNALDPNPIDLILELYRKREADARRTGTAGQNP